MAASDRLTGLNLYVEFDGQDLSGAWRAFTPTEGGVRADRTAGADASTSEAGIRKEGSATFEGLYDTTEATLIWSKVLPNAEATLIWGEEGTAAGKEKHTVDAIVRSRAKNVPYSDMISVTVEFGFQGVVADAAYA